MLDALAKRVPLLEFFPYLLMCPPPHFLAGLPV